MENLKDWGKTMGKTEGYPLCFNLIFIDEIGILMIFPQSFENNGFSKGINRG